MVGAVRFELTTLSTPMLMRYQAALRSDRAASLTQSIIVICLARCNLPGRAARRISA